MDMRVDRAEAAAAAAAEHSRKPAAQPRSPSPWDCGSSLYDAFELASVHRVLDTHLMALPFARRPCDDADALAGVLEVGVAKKRATARSRRRRRATSCTGKAVLRSILCGSVACGRRL